jgi:NitT/TauT family transport system substrate-binding protein
MLQKDGMTARTSRPVARERGRVRANVRTLAMTLALALVLIFGIVGLAGCDSSDAGTTSASVATTSGATSTTTAKLDKLTLVAPPGPMAIPMAYLAVNDKLADVAEETELVIWENADQLKALVAGGDGDFVTVPSNNAAIFYNKGLELRLLDISVWNITYVVTSDPNAAGFTDIKGQSLAVSLQGSVPDVMFQYLAMKEGLDPGKDFALRYATDPTQAAQLLMAGEVQNAVLSEALATAVILQTKDSATPLHKALAFDEAWAAAAGESATGESARTPIAGVVAAAGVLDKPEVITAFEREYAAAVEWMLANPEAAGQLVETELPQLGLKAAVMTASLQSITWAHTPAAEARASLEAFYTALMELSPEVIGGKLPDDGFYYAP